jgi:hypothetical protein
VIDAAVDPRREEQRMAQRTGEEPTSRQIPPGAMLDRLVRRDLLLLRLEAARGRRTAMVARVVGTRRQARVLRRPLGR